MLRFGNENKIKQSRSLGALLSAVLALMILFAAPVRAVITFSFNYTDPAGVGFNAANPLGAARKAALQQTGVLLSNVFPAYTATITMDVNGAETRNTTLAAAGPNFNSPSVCNPGFGANGDIAIKILGGADPAPATADGSVTVNFQDFVWGLGDTVPAGQFDFKSTMLHELFHAVGFLSTISQTGTSLCQPTNNAWSPFDQHLGNLTTNFINGAFMMNTTAWNAASIGGAGNAGTLFRGPNALAANAGNPIPIYSPNPYQGGSSISHLDDDFYTTTNFLMEAATGPGLGVRTVSAIESGMLQDIGYAQAAGAPCTGQSITITSPGTTTADTTPTYTWNALPCADQYFLWITDNAFTTQFAQYVTKEQGGCANGTGTCSFTPTTVLNPTGAFILMVPYSIATTTYGTWVFQSFDVCSGTIAPPIPVSPSGVIATNNPTYTWNAVPGTAWYNLYVVDANSQAQIYAWYTAPQTGCAAGTGTCSITPAGVPQSGNRLMYIYAYNQCGGSVNYGPPLFFQAP